MPPQNRRPIKALTVRQPFACSIAHLGQDVENRMWEPPPYMVGGYVAIHAGRSVHAESQQWLQDAIRFRTEPQLELPEHFCLLDHCARGAIVAVAQLRGVARIDGPNTNLPPDWTSPWFNGPVGWVWSNVVAFPKPIPCKGERYLWTLPPDVLTAVRDEFRRVRHAA